MQEIVRDDEPRSKEKFEGFAHRSARGSTAASNRDFWTQVLGITCMRCVRRRSRILFLVLVLSTQPTFCDSLSQAQPSTPESEKRAGRQDDPKHNCGDQGTYVNSQGRTVKRPENCSSVPHGATAQCRDGSYSFSKSRRGTCSHHGGVAKWL